MPAFSFDQSRTLGNQKFKSGNYGAALVHYTDCINQNPQAYALYCNRAAALIKLDSMDEAKDDLKKSLEVNPEYIPSLCRLGFILLYEGNTIEALESYVRAVLVCSRERAQLERFKSQLKEAIRLTENRARQQGYSQEYIDDIIPDNVRILLDSYRSLERFSTRQTNTRTPTVIDGGTEPVTNTGSGALGISGVGIPIFSRISTRPRNDNNNNDGSNAGTATMIGSAGPNSSFSISFGGPDGATGDLNDLFSNMFGGAGNNTGAQTNNTNTTGNTTRAQASGSTDQDAMDTTPDTETPTPTPTTNNINSNNPSNTNNNQQQNFQQIIMDRMRQAAQTYVTQQQQLQQGQQGNNQNPHLDPASFARNIMGAVAESFGGGNGGVGHIHVVPQSIQVEVPASNSTAGVTSNNNSNNSNNNNSNRNNNDNIDNAVNNHRVPGNLSTGNGFSIGNVISGFVDHISNASANNNTSSNGTNNTTGNSGNSGNARPSGNNNSTDTIPDDLDLD